MKRRLFAVLIGLLMLALPGAARAENGDIGADGAILIEGNSGRVLLSKNEDARLPMASTTKVMTALIAIENGDPDTLVKIPDAAVGVEGSSMYLTRGETLSLRDLLYGLMLTSGNDAAVAIAHHIAGSVEAFSALMNTRAEGLGCGNTNFVTPNGLHDKDHYTSAEDLALIAAEAMRAPLFREIVSTEYHRTTTGDRVRTLKNKNKTLWQYDGGCGVKTGFTKAAGKCLVFAAKRGETLLIGVLLRAKDMWGTAFDMLDSGFAIAKTERLLSAGQQVATLAVTNGVKKELAVSVKDDILYPMLLDGSDEIAFSVTLPDSLAAPVNAGETVGSITLYVNGEDVATTALTAMESVNRKGFYEHFLDLWHSFAA